MYEMSFDTCVGGYEVGKFNINEMCKKYITKQHKLPEFIDRIIPYIILNI